MRVQEELFELATRIPLPDTPYGSRAGSPIPPPLEQGDHPSGIRGIWTGSHIGFTNFEDSITHWGFIQDCHLHIFRSSAGEGSMRQLKDDEWDE